MRITRRSAKTQVSAASGSVSLKEVQDALYDAAVPYLKSASIGWDLSDIADMLIVDVAPTDSGFRAEVRCELSYDEMRGLSEILDKVIQKYDRDSYFDDVDPGIIEAYCYNSKGIYSAEDAMNEHENVIWLLDGDSGSWKVWGSTQKDDVSAGFLDAVNRKQNAHWIDVKVVPKSDNYDPNKDSSLKEAVTGADYGGAYDISPDQYFTRDDIMEFAYELADKLSSLYNDKIEIYDVDMKTPQDLYVELSAQDGAYQMAQTLHIDMRKIKKPSDLMKYLDKMAGMFAKDIKEIMDEVGVSSPEAAQDFARSYVGSAEEIEEDVEEDVEDVEEPKEAEPE